MAPRKKNRFCKPESKLQTQEMEQKNEKKEQKERKAKAKGLVSHIVGVVEARYGNQDSALETWQSLCRDVNEPEGRSITQCKKMLKNVFVNIIDWVKTIDETHPEHYAATVVRYPTENALRKYSNKHSLWFPLKTAKRSPILKALLIRM